MKDRLDQELAVGDIIAYGHALGRCAGLRIGKILQLKELPHDDQSGRHLYDSPYRITVRGIDDDWSFREMQLCLKNGTLMFPDRVVKIDRAHVPEKYLSLLDPVTLDSPEKWKNKK